MFQIDSVNWVKIPLLGILAGILAELLYWGLSTVISNCLELSPAAQLNLGKMAECVLFPVMLLLLFPIAIIIPNRSRIWRPDLAALTGISTSVGLLIPLLIYQKVWGMEHEFLQINDWGACISFDVMREGFPLFVVGGLVGAGVAVLRNSKIASSRALERTNAQFMIVTKVSTTSFPRRSR